MEAIQDIQEVNTFELADAGMTCLIEQFGVVGAEAFIALVLREKLDYTKWRRTFYDGMAPGEFHEKAVAYAKSHPYKGDAMRL
ncbi:MAG: hypothetical protein IJI57_00220 [Flexilinea sp.]|nr:hypothetical protein [Flexilinea sp.]